MKKAIFIAFMILAVVSCKKTNFEKVDSLSFGIAYGFCAGNCATFYKLEGGKIYRDSSTRYTGPGSIIFHPEALSKEKYLLAKELKDKFPAYLLKNVDQTFGCPDCTDQGGIHIEVKENDVLRFWHIDTNTSKQPAEIRTYIERMLSIISQL